MRLAAASCSSALVLALVAASARADVSALDEAGRILTVGNFHYVQQGNNLRRVENIELLGFELFDETGALAAHGIVPGSEGDGLDSSPALVRDPHSDSIWLAWSRQATAGESRDISMVRFSSGLFWPGTSRPVATGLDDQLDPSLVFDSLGRIWLTWIDAAENHSVRLAYLTASGSRMGERILSDGVSTGNSSPAIGVNEKGEAVVAFLGLDAGAQPRLFVLEPSAGTGGVTHVPNPIVDLCLRGELTADSAPVGTTSQGDRVRARVNLTVLAGITVAWWARQDAVENTLYYAVEPAGGWSVAEIEKVPLAGPITSPVEALALVEARLRRALPIHATPISFEPRLPGPFGGRLRIIRPVNPAGNSFTPIFE